MDTSNRTLILLALAVCVIGGLLAAGPAGATFPGTDGQVAFGINNDNTNDPAYGDIWLLPPSGSGHPVDLTQECVVDPDNPDYYKDIGQGFDPVWSPNGKKLAYVAEKNFNQSDEQTALFTINPDGTGRTQITPFVSDGTDGGPNQIAWSPDGSRLAFADLPDVEGQNNRLYFADVSTKAVTSVPGPSGREGIYTLSWSPTSNVIAFTSDSEPFESGDGETATEDIYTMKTDGSDATQLTSTYHSADPDFSPDGQTIAFDTNYGYDSLGYSAGDTGLYLMNANGSDQRAVPGVRTTSGAQGDANFNVQTPSFSPDGKRLLFLFTASDLDTNLSDYTVPVTGGQPTVFGDGNYYDSYAGSWGTDHVTPPARPLCAQQKVTSGSGPPGGNKGGSGPSSAKRLITHVTLKPSSFIPASRGGSTARRANGHDTRITYRTSRAGTVKFTVREKLAGRVAKTKKCVAVTRKDRRRRHCTRLVRLKGSFTQRAKTGAEKLYFTGRLAGKALKPGRYELVLTETGSRTVTIPFSIRSRGKRRS